MPLAMSFSISSTPVSQPVISPRPGNSIVHPIHKSGFLSDASNFRPISIVPAFPKLVERIVQRQLYYYMASNHLFSQSQHGFRSNHSTETALLTVSDHILSATDRQAITLLPSTYLTCPNAATWLTTPSSYPNSKPILSIRPGFPLTSMATQSVCTADGRGNRHLSRSLPNHIGVFQVSSLGPFLFQIFANDLRRRTAGTAGARGTRVGFVVCREPGRISLYYVALPPSRPQPIGSRKLLEPRSRSAVHRDENFVS